VYAAIVHQDAQPLAQEVVGDLIELAVFGNVQFRVGADGLVDRTGEAGLVDGIQVRTEEDLVAVLPVQIQCGNQAELAFRERAGLVGAQDVHAAEVLH
jgi:hypothetical protein